MKAHKVAERVPCSLAAFLRATRVSDGSRPLTFRPPPAASISEPPRGAIILPEAALHPSQVEALDLIREHRRVALVCGRRWGKTTILITLAVDARCRANGLACSLRHARYCRRS